VLGTAAWLGFLHAAPDIRAALEAHREDWGKLQSIFTSARILGAPLRLAYAAQAALAAAALAVLALACLRRPGAPAEMALTATAAMLCTPHLLDYDLAVTGVPLAWLAAQASTTGWRPYEKAGAVLAFLWPLLARILTQSYDLAIAPLIMLALFTLVLRRARPAPAGAPA
jgi:hypothetical protein